MSELLNGVATQMTGVTLAFILCMAFKIVMVILEDFIPSKANRSFILFNYMLGIAAFLGAAVIFQNNIVNPTTAVWGVPETFGTFALSALSAFSFSSAWKSRNERLGKID